MTKRPRTEIELRFLSDCVYSAIVEYGQSKLPLCKYTLAHLYFSEFHGRVEDHVNQFPQHFGYLRDFLNRKNFNRFIGHVKSLADDKDVLNSLKESYRNTQIRFSHENSSPLVEGIPCNVCFYTPTTNIVDDIKSRCKKLLTDFSNKELACGNNFKEIHECICETSFQILSSYDKSIENFKDSFDELKVEFQRYKLELTDNLAKFDDHLKEVSAVIHYGSGLSGSGVQHLDRTIFCREFTKKDIEQHLSNLPDYRHIKSSDPNVEFGDLFHEYCSHVLTHLCEPSFFKLGQKYSLTGIKGGSSAARLSEHAQSICLNYLLFPCNHGIYSELRPILAVHSNARTRYTPHPLVDGLSIPRLPSVSEADEKVEILRELQSILLGTPQIPVHYEGWDLVKSCPKQVAANSRLVDLMSIRKHSLSFQSDNKFLKAKSTEHYQNLSIDEVKSTLKIYSLICESDFQKYDENFLRKKLQEAESTRSFAMWYDHAVILNRSYILFVVWPLFSKSVYQSKDLIEGDLQKAVEQIYVHYIAMSPSTTNSEEALQEFRTEQLASFKVKIQGESGIEFTDRLKFVNGDAPMSSVIVLDPFLTGEVEFRNYLTISHANSLFKNLLNLPFEDHHKNRSSLWYGCMDYVYSKVSIKSRGPLSSLRPLHQLGNRLSKDLGCDFNSCLVNFYKDGSDSCGWHADDEGIFGENPTIASISLGCTRQFQLMPIPGTLFSKNCTTFFDLSLRHGDLIVMKGDVQKYWHHCVPRQAGKCTARINLTFRHVVTRSS